MVRLQNKLLVVLGIVLLSAACAWALSKKPGYTDFKNLHDSLK